MAKWSALSSPMCILRNVFDLGVTRVQIPYVCLIIDGLSFKAHSGYDQSIDEPCTIAV